MYVNRSWYWRKPVAVLAGGVAWLIATQAYAQQQVVEIEEHWELAIGEPDAPMSAPQATLVMSPNGNLEGQYFLVTINHRNVPDYAPGGVQVRLWNDDAPVAVESFGASTLDQTNDTIRWVQRLHVQDGTLSFQVVDGSSLAWGGFGGESLSLSTPTELSSLNGYRPAISIGESQVGYAGNRVQHLTLTKLVWRTADGESHELHAPIDIDADLDP
jgi:hypothetical protein